MIQRKEAEDAATTCFFPTNSSRTIIYDQLRLGALLSVDGF